MDQSKRGFVDGHVEMNSPRTGRLFVADRVQCQGEIRKIFNVAIFADARLVQVFRLSKRRQLRKRFGSCRLVQRVKIDLDGRRDLNFSNHDFCLSILVERRRLRFEHHGRVADVMAYAKVPVNQLNVVCVRLTVK